MPTSPAFQFYARDFILSTSEMTAAEVGAYIRLLCAQWESGSLPESVGRLAAMAGTTAEVVGGIMSKLPLGEDGRRRNPRMERVRAEQDAYRTAQSERAAKRWSKHAGPMPPHMPWHIPPHMPADMPGGMPDACSPSPSPSPSPTPKEPPPTPQGGRSASPTDGTVSDRPSTAGTAASPPPLPQDASVQPGPPDAPPVPPDAPEAILAHIRTIPKKPKPAPAPPPIPPALDTPAFRAAWDDWLAYRRERKLSTPKPRSASAKFAELAEWGPTRACIAIRASIANNWQGIFEPKVNGVSHGTHSDRRLGYVSAKPGKYDHLVPPVARMGGG